MLETHLGKIVQARIGFGGYQEAMFGLTIVMDYGPYSSIDFISCGWKSKEKCNMDLMGQMAFKLLELLMDSNVSSLEDLVGVPVEVTLGNGGVLAHWRVLTEVI